MKRATKTRIELRGKATGRLIAGFLKGDERIWSDLQPLGDVAWLAARVCGQGYTMISAYDAETYEEGDDAIFGSALLCLHRKRGSMSRDSALRISLPRLDEWKPRKLPIRPMPGEIEERSGARFLQQHKESGAMRKSEICDPLAESVLSNVWERLREAGYSALIIYNDREGRKSKGRSLFKKTRAFVHWSKPVECDEELLE